MSDVDRILQAEVRGDREKIVGIVIHVVAVGGLRGSPVAAAVMRDDAIAVIEEEHHLRVPIVGRQRPAVAEHDGLTLAPILVENLHAVLGSDRRHFTLLCALSSSLNGRELTSQFRVVH
jgi:hypothetical protein